jgi:membrane associated rhomboid family serine protease
MMENLLIRGVSGAYYINRYFALNPLGGTDYYGQPYNFQVWQLVTYQFLHGDIMHIFFNMFALWMFGVEIENMWGSKRFLTFYLVCGIGAGLLHIFLTPVLAGTLAPTIGASGAVYGVLIAFAMLFPDRYIFIYFLLPVKAKYLIAFYIILEFMSVGSASYVAHLAHLGGALFGFIMVLYYRRRTLSVGNFFNSFKKPQRPAFRKPKSFSSGSRHVEDADYYDINSKQDDSHVTQAEIDAILDKISQSGYKSLSEREKRILFEASKKG